MQDLYELSEYTDSAHTEVEDLSSRCINGSNVCDMKPALMVMSLANGLVRTGFASRYRLQPIAGF